MIASAVLWWKAENFGKTDASIAFIQTIGQTIGFVSAYYAFYHIFVDEKLDGLFVAFIALIYLISSGLTAYLVNKSDTGKGKEENPARRKKASAKITKRVTRRVTPDRFRRCIFHPTLLYVGPFCFFSMYIHCVHVRACGSIGHMYIFVNADLLV